MVVRDPLLQGKVAPKASSFAACQRVTEISHGHIRNTKAWLKLKLTKGVKVKKKDIKMYVSCQKEVQEKNLVLLPKEVMT